jgi:hypothetical protein
MGINRKIKLLIIVLKNRNIVQYTGAGCYHLSNMDMDMAFINPN